MTEECIQRIIKESQDSITLGSPTNGQVKVYGDAGNPADFKKKLDAAIKILHDAQGP